MATIRHIILLAITALMVVGCDEINNKIKEVENAQQKKNTTIQEWHNPIIIIDSCEYIGEETRGLVEHKGNCRFCKERDSIKWEKRKKELKELVIELKEK